MSKLKSKQCEIFPANYEPGDVVRFVQPTFRGGQCNGTHLSGGIIYCSVMDRPGWYYVTDLNGRKILLEWRDLYPVHD